MKRRAAAPGLPTSIWLYDQLLKLHTPRFQAQYRHLMLLTHEDAYHDAWDTDGPLGITMLWFRECLSLVPDVWNELAELHQDAVRQEISMREFLSVVAQYSSVALMVFAGLVGILFWHAFATQGVYQSRIEWAGWFIILFDGAIAVVGLLCLAFWKTIAAKMS